MKMDEVKRYKMAIVALIVVNVMIIAVWWFFNIGDDAPRNKHNNDWRNNRRNFFEQTLMLDEAQKSQFAKLGEEHKKFMDKTNKEIDSLKASLGKEILEENGSQEKIDLLFNSIATRRAAIDTSIYHHFKRLRKVCTPEQAVKFDSIMTEFMMRRDRPMRRGMGEPLHPRPQPENREKFDSR